MCHEGELNIMLLIIQIYFVSQQLVEGMKPSAIWGGMKIVFSSW